MTREDLYKSISEIRPDFLEEAASYKVMKRHSWKRWGVIAACLCICVGSAVPVLAAADNKYAYEVLYAISPAIAQKLKPVNVSCEDNGIRMKVMAVDVEGANVKILVSMQDLVGERLQADADLFDSYSIHTPYDQTGNCTFVEYDSQTRTATFLINIEQLSESLTVADKITFSVSNILSGKKQVSMPISEIDMHNLPQITDYVEAPAIRGYGGSGMVDLKEIHLINSDQTVLLEEGVTLTGYGFVDDMLHVQLRYDDILNTDNHGYVYLKKADGETIESVYDVSFWDEVQKDSYEEYIFELNAEELQDYELWGEFWTCNGGAIEGDWQVTFPIDNNIITNQE